MTASTPQQRARAASRPGSAWLLAVGCAMLLGTGCASPWKGKALSEVPPPAVAVAPLEVERLPPVDVPNQDWPVQAAGYVAQQPAGAAPQTTFAQVGQKSAATVDAVRTSFQEEMPGPRGQEIEPRVPTLPERLQIPPQVPGASAPPLLLPPASKPEERAAVIDLLFPDLPPVAMLQSPQNTQPLGLADLERMALENNPVIAQAAANVTVAMGAAIQAGVYPNPMIGYEADTVGSAGTRNYQGVFGTQLIKTAGKLNLARSVANIDVMNAQLALRKARIDLLAKVKASYFAVLVAQESITINAALVRFTGEAYQIQDDKLKVGGVAAAYEPAQLRSLADMAQVALMQAQNGYIATWKQLAVTVGAPGLPMTTLLGTAEMPVPRMSFEAALARMLNVHPDVQAARNSRGQAVLNRRLQQVTPIPDVNVYGTFQRDFTTPNTPRTTYNVQFGVPLPLWDRNRGNLLSAEGSLRRSTEQIRRSEFELTGLLADAFARFEIARIQLQYYREHILPDLARAYRGIYERYQQEEEQQVGFGDIIVAQQNLTAAVSIYIATLGAQWTAVTDLAALLQVESLNELNLGSGDAPGGEHAVDPAPR